MFKDFLTALIQKIVTHLKSHSDFFTLSEDDREKNLEAVSIPRTFKKYLVTATEKTFINDLGLIVRFSNDSKNSEIKGNEFFKHLVEFLNSELALKIDHINGDFYLLNKKERIEIVEKLIKGESTLAQTLKTILVNFTYQQLTQEVFTLGSIVMDAPYILVQSPREIDTELKREIRNQLTEKYPASLPAFQINRKLIGGLRIFENGKSIDHSWISRVTRFTSLTSN